MRRHRMAAVAVALGCVLGVAACGSSDDDGGSGTAGGGSAGGGTIKLMALGPIEAPGFSVPSIPVGARAAVNEINKAGGIDGKQLELIACNDRNDPNEAIGCARRAIDEGVAAIVGGYTQFEPQIIPLLERAGIPWVGPPALQNTTSPSYYLIGGEAATMTLAMGQYLNQQGCRSVVAIGENVPAGKAAVRLFQAGVSASGGTNADAVYGASNAADWSPVVAAALDKANCVTFLGSPTNTPKVVTAIAQSGKHPTFITAESLLPAPSVAALGKAADGAIMTSGYLPFTSDAPGIRALQREARAVDPKLDPDASQLESGYAAVKTVAAAARGLGEVTPASLRTGLDGLKHYDTGVGPVVDFTARNPTRAFSRASNPRIFLFEARDGRVVLKDTEPLDVTPIFQALARAGT